MSASTLFPSEPAALPTLLVTKQRPVDVDVLARRTGRIAFGVGFLVGPALISLLHVAGAVEVEHVAPFLLTGWFGALLARIVVTAVAPGWFSEGKGRTGDELLFASLAVPGVVLALFGPLSLHAPFALLMDGNRALDGWAAMSFVAVGFAHLVLAALVVARAWRLVEGEEAMTPRRIYWLVVGASCVPGVLALGIPPLLTAVTGLCASPLLQRMQVIVDSERRRLAD
jgi:hypothetical protein